MSIEWAVCNSLRLTTLGEHDGVEELAVTADSRWLLSVGVDDRLAVWPLGVFIRDIPIMSTRSANEQVKKRKRAKSSGEDVSSFFDGFAVAVDDDE